VDALVQDLRYAGRMLARSPGFTALVVLCLALGIGVNSTIFSLVDTIAIRPLPFHDPERLVDLHSTHAANGIDFSDVSYLDLLDWRARSRAFADVGASAGRSLTLSDRGEPERFNGTLVTWNLFPMLGVEPMLGRQIRPEEDSPGGPRVVLLSHGVWQRRYAADPAIIGRTITVDGNATTVIGVMPPRFQFPGKAEIWLPLTPFEFASPRTARSLEVFARRRPDWTFEAARRDIAAVGERLAQEVRDDQGWGASAQALRDAMVPSDIRLMVMTMMGAVTLVLLIACANVANLLLARATVRGREMAVRAALGAGHGRIARQLLTESVLLALGSAPLGVAVAYVGLRWLTASIPPQNQPPYYIDWSMNPRVVLYTGLIAIATGLLFGLAPASHAARHNLHDALKDRGASTGGAGRHRLRAALVVAEMGLAVVLLVGAALFIRSFVNLEHARAGLDSSRLMTLRFFMSGGAYDAPEAMSRRVDDIVRRVESLPGVASAFASNMVPFASGGSDGGAVPDPSPFQAGQEPNVRRFGVTPHLLKTLGVPIVAGRDFTDAEGGTRAGVAIVNTVFAKRLWPDKVVVVGERFRLVEDPGRQWITVVGVVGDFRLFTVRDGKPPPYAFLPYPYDAARNTGLTIRVTSGPPAGVAGAVRQEIRRSDPTLPIFRVETGDEVRLDSFFEDRIFGWMFAIFGVVALTLASIGVYGVLSYSVSQRTSEIGVRMALGASRPQVFGLVIAQAARLAGAGILCGIAGALVVTRIVASFLYNVAPTDPISFGATALFLALVAVAASCVPARRATAVDPMIALRAE
jgi:putative ABC transport system permease protein